MIRAALLLALLALGCAGADADDTSIDADILASSAPAVEAWLPPEHPAAAAQARWGLPIRCAGFRVVEYSRDELQPVCNSAAELAARAAGVTTNGCVRPLACELDVANDLAPAFRQVVLTHELGHLLDVAGVDRHVQEGCPVGKPGAHLMCSGGPASGEPDPTPADFDLVLGG